jgi:Tfp pilus assembly protein FimT
MYCLEGRRAMSRLKSNSGITIIELMMVIIILGFLAALAVPNLVPMVDMIKLRTAANAVKRQMIIARTRALSDPNVHVGVCIDTRTNPNRSFVFFDVATGTAYHNDASDPVYMGEYRVPKNIWDSIPSVANGGISDSVVVFRGDGSAKNGGTVILKNRYGRIRTISVLASTGRVKMY